MENLSLIETLMRRDNMSRSEAQDLLEQVYNMVQEAIDEGNLMEAEEIFQDELGLEPDYLPELFL
jgi:nucleoid DNA-binding protein